MAKLRARVEKGKIVVDAPRGLEEGTELELCIADPGDDMTDEELGRLNHALEEAWRSVQAGRVQLADDVLSDLRNRRRPIASSSPPRPRSSFVRGWHGGRRIALELPTS